MPRKSQLVNDISNTYDELPYASNAFSQTHPDFLRALCSLFDVETPPVETAKILEIGCAFGGNILPLAMQYPNATLVGLDISEKQVAAGKSAIKATGLKNIQLKKQDVTTYKVPEKHFDYIICHGVYSWVPESVKEAILHVISKGLSEKGVAIVSYNTYPGWKIREVYRDVMLYRSRPVDDIREKIKYGFGMLDFLNSHLPKESPWGVAIEQHYQAIRQASPSYLAHEYFEVVNEPCYFHEFMDSAQSKGLRFVAEADFQNHFFPPVTLDNDSLQALQREADGDIIKLEQLHDFLSNRTFRQTLLSRNAEMRFAEPDGRKLRHEALSKLHIQGSFVKEVNEEKQEVQWKSEQSPGGAGFKDMLITEAVFTVLNAAEGQTVQVGELWNEIQTTLENADKQQFFRVIAEIILNRGVRIRTAAVQWQSKESPATGGASASKPSASKPSASKSSASKSSASKQMPRISAVNRKLLQWIQDNPETIGLTTAFHDSLRVDVVADELLPLLDGKHSKLQLYKKLIAAVMAGRIVFYDDKQEKVKEAKQVAAAAKEHTEKLLAILRYNGLLC